MMLGGQATTLKRITYGDMGESGLRVLAVSSGKGGVGKTNIVANLSYALSKRGNKVLVVDADLGLNNIDILFGLASKKHIGHVLSGESNVEEIIFIVMLVCVLLIPRQLKMLLCAIKLTRM